MSLDWKRACRGDDIEVAGTTITVRFDDQRKHAVEAEEHDDHFLLTATVATQRALKAAAKRAGQEHEAPHVQAWRHNRSMSLVGFRQDKKGRIVGTAWVPKAGLTEAEFLIYVRAVARESDRIEFLLTGDDEH